MIFNIITIFPDFFDGFLKNGVIARALTKNNGIKINVINLRDFAEGPHRITDDRPFGGGPGMVMMPEPIYQALKSALPERFGRRKNLSCGTKRRTSHDARVILLSPQGTRFNHDEAKRLARYKHLVFICGRYEGVDERIMDFVDEELSIGDFVISGGEPAAMVVIDAIARLIDDGKVVKERSSVENDSFYSGPFLDCPHYTRPAVWRSRKVPSVLLSGNHKKIEDWRKKQAILNTRKKRPDLFACIMNKGIGSGKSGSKIF